MSIIRYTKFGSDAPAKALEEDRKITREYKEPKIFGEARALNKKENLERLKNFGKIGVKFAGDTKTYYVEDLEN